MNRRSGGPTWPVIGLLLVLFALSITAPMNWNRTLPASGPEPGQGSFESCVEPFADPQLEVASAAAAEAERVEALPTTGDVAHVTAPAAAFGLTIIPPALPFTRPWYSSTTQGNVTLPAFDGSTMVEQSEAAGQLPRIDDVVNAEFAADDADVLSDADASQVQTDDGENLVVTSPAEDLPATAAPIRTPAPASVLTLLVPLQSDAAFGDWAAAVEAAVGQLQTPDGVIEAAPLLRELEAKAVGLIAGHPTHRLAAEMRRAKYALQRRILLWDVAAGQATDAGDATLVAPQAPVDWQAISFCLAELQDLSIPGAEAWRQRLLLDGLEDLAMQNAARRSEADVLARQALDKIAVELQSKATTRTAASPLLSLAEQLRPLAAGQIGSQDVLNDVESFELTRSAQAAAKLAEDRDRLQWSDDARHQELGAWLDEHYYGGNFRLNISSQLLDRLTDQPATVEGPIRQMVLGVPTTGYSTTSTRIRYRLVPDESRWRVAVVAEGKVAANTEAQSGPARLFNRSDATFLVEKQIELTGQGLQAQPAQASANSDTELQGVQSTLDWVPVLRKLAHNVIRNQYAARHGAARADAQAQISRRAEAEIDAQVSDRLQRANDQFQRHVLQPLERLGLTANANFQTSPERLTARVRVAGQAQLAAHTPRPQAPSDSQASVQIHESALNNVLDRLDVAGRTLTMAELYSAVCEKLNLGPGNPPESMPADVRVTLAAEQPIRVDLQQGQLKLTLAFAEIHHQSDHWRDFRVMVFYRPDLIQPGGPLVRDGVVQLDGKRVRAKGQVALRGVFSKMFPKDEPWQLMPPVLVSDPRLAGLTVTQFAIQDGWIGWALGPDPTKIASTVASIPRVAIRHDATRGIFLRRTR